MLQQKPPECIHKVKIPENGIIQPYMGIASQCALVYRTRKNCQQRQNDERLVKVQTPGI